MIPRQAAQLALALMVIGITSSFAADIPEQIQKYIDMAKEGKDDDGLKKLGESILKDADKEADQLNEFAWKILTEDGIKKRDLALAMRVAKAAYDASEGKNAAIVDTYARAFFDSGDKAEGIKLQKKALELAEDDNLKTELKTTLERYEKEAAEAKKEPKKTEEKK
jgi:hypothetical protein